MQIVRNTYCVSGGENVIDLKSKRKQQGLTQGDLAHVAKLSASLIWKLENGERKPSVKVAKRIASILGFDWTDFFKETA